MSDDGALYYLARGTGASTGVVYRIEYGNKAPSITMHPSIGPSRQARQRRSACERPGPPPLRYQWQRNSVNISGATAQDYTLAGVALSDNGAQFRALVTNDFDSVLSNAATLTVTGNRAPTGTIRSRQPERVQRRQRHQLLGHGDRSRGRTLPGSAFTWRVDFHHDTHTHPFIPPTTGASSGSFTIPNTGQPRRTSGTESI